MNVKTATPDTCTTNTSHTQVSTNQICLLCSTNPMEYSTVPCNHKTLCKQCAMKQATGGKCKVCHQMFSQLERI